MIVIIPFQDGRNVELLRRTVASIIECYTADILVVADTAVDVPCHSLVMTCGERDKEARIIEKYIAGMNYAGVDSAICTCHDVVWNRRVDTGFFGVVYATEFPINRGHGAYVAETMRHHSMSDNYAIHMPHRYELKKLEALDRRYQIENEYYGRFPSDLISHDRVTQDLFASTKPDPRAFFHNYTRKREMIYVEN